MRAWDGRTGAPLAAIRAHQGRGAWCLCALSPSTIATGGGDCALKLWRLSDWIPPHAASMLHQPLHLNAIGSQPQPPGAADVPPTAPPEGSQPAPVAAAPTTLQTTTCMPEALAASGTLAKRTHLNSSEGICALALAAADRLYAVTSLGRVVRVGISLHEGRCEVDWTEVADVSAGGIHLSCCSAQPLHAYGTCTEHASRTPPSDGAQAPRPCSKVSQSAADAVVVGSRQGALTILRVPVANPDLAEVLACWEEPKAGVIAVFLPKALPQGHVMCAGGEGRLWWLFVPTLAAGKSPARATAAGEDAASGEGGTAASTHVVVAGWCVLNPKHRVAAVDVVPSAALVIVGDSVGGVAGFSVPAALMRADTRADVEAAVRGGGGEAERGFAAACRFGKCHGTQPVTMVAALPGCVYTGGRNGAALLDCCLHAAP